MKRFLLFVFFIGLFCFINPIQVSAREYIVQTRDTFSEICLKILGSGAETVWVNEAKRLKIEKPHLIFPGMKLDFPHVRICWRWLESGEEENSDWFLIAVEQFDNLLEFAYLSNREFSEIIFYWWEFLWRNNLHQKILEPLTSSSEAPFLWGWFVVNLESETGNQFPINQFPIFKLY